MDTEVLRDRPLVHVRPSDSLELMKDISSTSGIILLTIRVRQRTAQVEAAVAASRNVNPGHSMNYELEIRNHI